MSVLCDSDILDLIIEKKLVITPFSLDSVQPSSVDLRLDGFVRIPKHVEKIDLSADNSGAFEEGAEFETFDLAPGGIVLCQILEQITIPVDCNGHLHNRSSLVRLGLDVATGSYINPGYSGKLPLLIKNNSTSTITLVKGIRICQLELTQLSSTPLRDYSNRKDAKYFGEEGTLISQLHLDHELLAFKQNKNSSGGGSLADFLLERVASHSKEAIENIPEEMKKRLGI